MADNITIKDGAGVDAIVSADEVTRNAIVEKQQIFKIGLGAEGSHDMVVDSGQQTMANSVPVVLASDQPSEVLVDDAAFAPATSRVGVAGFTLDDTSTDAVDEGDVGAARITADRKQLVMLGESGANFVKGGGAKTDTTDQSIMAAGGSGFFNYLCWIAVYNSSSTNTAVNIKDGSTIVAVIPLPAYGGAVLSLPVPIRGSDNTAFNFAAVASVTTAQLYGGGYKGR